MNDIEISLELVRAKLEKIPDPYLRDVLISAYSIGAAAGVIMMILVISPSLPLLWAEHKVWELWKRRGR